MKHTLRVTLLLLGLFFVAQLVGLTVIDSYTTYETVVKDGKKVQEKTWTELPYEVERPNFAPETSYLPILGIILLSTFIVLLIVKFRAVWFWKLWFFLAVWFCLVIAFSAFVAQHIALVVALLLALLKVARKSIILHNITELFIYGGLAAIFVPILSLVGAGILLILISFYDFIAVHKTKHMVTLAKFQSKSKLFAGLLIPYGKQKTAVLGGGDIAFPLLFAAVVMQSYGTGALLVSFAATLGLAYLLWKSEKNKFYPAMPFLTAGCFLGYGFLRFLLLL